MSKNSELLFRSFPQRESVLISCRKFVISETNDLNKLISDFLSSEKFSRTFCHSAYQPKVEDCYNFELKNRSWVSRNSCVKFRKSKKFQRNVFLRFSFKFQLSFLKQVSTEFRKSLEIVDTRKMFANVFVYGLLRGLGTKVSK